MKIDPFIYFIMVVPDGQPEEATPMQGFAMSLCEMSWALRAIAHLPTNIYDLTDGGREVLLARRMSGTSRMHWYGQSPKAIQSVPHPPFLPFTLIILPESENAESYRPWANSSRLPPALVAKAGGDLSYEDLRVDKLQSHFLKLCDRMSDIIDASAIEDARNALTSWKAMPEQKLGYQVGGHNSIAPNLAALGAAGFVEMVQGPFTDVNSGLKPYVDQIVRTTNSLFDERENVGERDLQRIFRRPPDLNLFAPAIYPSFFEIPLPADADREAKKLFSMGREALMRQTGYNFEIRSEAQKKAVLGAIVKGEDGFPAVFNPMMSLRARELSLSTELMTVTAASEFSAVVRLPNEINRTLGSVRNFSEHHRSTQPSPRKRLLAFRQVQDRLARAVPADFMDLVRRSKSGIRIVSDAHLEWLDLDGLPLAIRRNCTRIPVTPGNLFVDNMATRQLLHMAPDDFKSILVISALTRDDPIRGIFETAFDVFEPQWRDRLSVTFVDVSNEEELINAINEFKGPMVIFDGHGSHNKDEAAQLHLGATAVDVWSLRGKITNIAPIIILSACDTHAADRNHATTANGFMHLGARTVLSSVFPLQAHAAAAFAARLVFRVAAFLGPAIKAFDEAITWTEVISGMLRMQLLTDFLRQLMTKGKIDEVIYERIHLAGNNAINGRDPDPFATVVTKLEAIDMTKKSLELELEIAVANSSAISYLQIGRPETILIDDPQRMKAQMSAEEYVGV